MQVKVQSHSIQTDKPLREEKPHYTSLIMNETGSHFFFRDKTSVCIFRQRQKGVQIRAAITHGWGMLKPACVRPAQAKAASVHHRHKTLVADGSILYHWTGKVAHWSL